MSKKKNGLTVKSKEGVDTGVDKKTAKKLRPAPGKVFVWRIYRDEETNSKIYVHNRKKEQTPFAIVLAVSDLHNEWFTVGETVIVLNHCGTDTTIKGHRISIIDETDIIGVYEDDTDEELFNEEHLNAANTKKNIQKQKGTMGKEFRQ